MQAWLRNINVITSYVPWEEKLDQSERNLRTWVFVVGILPLCRRMTCKIFEWFEFSILNEVNIFRLCFVLKLFWPHNRYHL